MSVGSPLAGACDDEAVKSPGFEDGVELRASVFSPDSADDTGEGEYAVV